MRITEEQQEILESLVCERLSRNPANMREIGFYKKDTMQAVAAFCVINTDISVDLIPKSTRNKLNRKIPYAKQRDHYSAVLIGQIAVFDDFA